MPFERLIALLPESCLESLVLRRPSDEADQLISAWSALWHPAFLAEAQGLPNWVSSESAPESPSNALIAVPECSEVHLAAEWRLSVDVQTCCVVWGCSTRESIVEAGLAHMGKPVEGLDAELIADFHALGVGHLLVEILTRQMRYTSNVDEYSLQSAVLEGARAVMAGETANARSALERAFQLLYEARQYFYPVDLHLIDLTLVAPSTLGDLLCGELGRPIAGNYMMPGDALEAAASEPETVRRLAEAVASGRAAWLGGDLRESVLPLLPPDAIVRRLRGGRALGDRILGRGPAVYARRRFGLTPALPQLLRKTGFTGALHFTLDDGKFPSSNQSRVEWEGFGEAPIEALARIPLDAGRSETFLRLPERIGDVMDLDHTATLVFAHWPGGASRWYADLWRIAAYSPVLGSFESVDSYLADSGYSGQLIRPNADEYRSPYLRESVDRSEANPISRYTDYYRRWAALGSCQTLAAFCAALGGDLCNEAIETLWGQVDRALEQNSLGSELDETIFGLLVRHAAELASRLAGAGPKSGPLAVNPWSSAQKVWADGGPKRGTETPGLGFARIEPDPPPPPEETPGWFARLKPKKAIKPAPLLAEENLLRNEFFEAKINPATGGILSVSDYQTRSSRLGQQLAMRLSERREVHRDEWGHEVEDPNAAYSRMAADEIRIVAATETLGEIASRGRLTDLDGQLLARFEQTARVRRGSRVLELEISLDPIAELKADPWRSYFAVRWAWTDEAASLYRSVSLASRPTESTQIESPLFVDVRSQNQRTTFLSGGLPFHRKVGLHMLDTLLIVRGETARKFRLGAGFDLPTAVPAALAWLAPPVELPQAPLPDAKSGWLFHVDVRNVTALHWTPLLFDGRMVGVRCQLQETEGRPVTPRIRSFRPLVRAMRLATGGTREELPVDGDRVSVPMRPHEWTELDCYWESVDGEAAP